MSCNLILIIIIIIIVKCLKLRIRNRLHKVQQGQNVSNGIFHTAQSIKHFEEFFLFNYFCRSLSIYAWLRFIILWSISLKACERKKSLIQPKLSILCIVLKCKKSSRIEKSVKDEKTVLPGVMKMICFK